MAKSKIIIGKDNGMVKNVIFDDCDLSKSQTMFRVNTRVVNNHMMLTLDIELNDKFEITFE